MEMLSNTNEDEKHSRCHHCCLSHSMKELRIGYHSLCMKKAQLNRLSYTLFSSDVYVSACSLKELVMNFQFSIYKVERNFAESGIQIRRIYHNKTKVSVRRIITLQYAVWDLGRNFALIELRPSNFDKLILPKRRNSLYANPLNVKY